MKKMKFMLSLVILSMLLVVGCSNSNEVTEKVIETDTEIDVAVIEEIDSDIASVVDDEEVVSESNLEEIESDILIPVLEEMDFITFDNPGEPTTKGGLFQALVGENSAEIEMFGNYEVLEFMFTPELQEVFSAYNEGDMIVAEYVEDEITKERLIYQIY